MKKTSKFLSMILAVIMVLAMSAVPAFAADQGLTVSANTPNGSITVNKTLTVDANTPIPNETFTFTLTPVTDTEGATYEGQAIKPGVAVTDNDTTIEFTNASTSKTGTGTISFAGASFTEPGIYRYSLQETAGSTTGMTYDQSKFYVDIYVGYTDPAANAGTMEILGVKTFRYINADGSKVETIGAKTTNEFTNTFNAEGLVISKTVTGNMGDRNKDFDFSLNIPATTQLTAGTELKAVKTTSDGTSVVTVVVGTTYDFALKHGENLEIKGLSVGTEYTVTEDSYAADRYTTTLVTTENGTAATPVEVNTMTNQIVDGGNTEAFTNNKNITTPTGILLDIAPYALVVLLALGGVALMIFKKRRSTAR